MTLSKYNPQSEIGDQGSGLREAGSKRKIPF